MKLIYCDIRPGKVLKVLDNGVIKASCCGIFPEYDNDEDISKLPNIYPYPKPSKAWHSSPSVDDEVWVMSFSDNRQELFYTFKEDIEVNADIFEADKDIDIIFHRHNDTDTDAYLYYKEGEGVICNVDKSRTEINKDNIILNRDDKFALRMYDKGIEMGSATAPLEPAVKGDKLADLLEDICDMLSNVSNVASGNPHTIAISTTISALLPPIQSKINSIKSKDIKIT